MANNSGFNWGNLASAAVGGLFGWIGSRQQNRANMRMAQFQLDANRELLREQLEYDTPKNQMLRFQDAGLNPHLIYGQGNPGNQSTPLSMPDIKPADMQSWMQNIVPTLNQTKMVDSQVAAQNANTLRTGVLTELNKLQTKVLENNPMLDKTYVSALIQSMIATAQSKEAQAGIDVMTSDWFRGEKTFMRDGQAVREGPAGVLKMEAELDLLQQRFDLGTADQKLKASILQSKEFQNALSEIQLKWLRDAEITPQHVYQGILMLLMKML